jgi:hypothetical protein
MLVVNVLVRRVKHDIHPESPNYTANLVLRCLRLKFFGALGARVRFVFVIFVLFEVVRIALPCEAIHPRFEALPWLRIYWYTV